MAVGTGKDVGVKRQAAIVAVRAELSVKRGPGGIANAQCIQLLMRVACLQHYQKVNNRNL